ncbi:hypothetical protein JOM56_001740 [Amanita muscaria]
MIHERCGEHNSELRGVMGTMWKRNMVATGGGNQASVGGRQKCVQDRLALETGKMKELENGMEHAMLTFHMVPNTTFIWWIIPGLLVKSGKKWDCTGTLPGLLVFYRGGDLAGNTAKLHQASTGTLPGLSGKVLAIYQDFAVITRYGNSISTEGFL